MEHLKFLIKTNVKDGDKVVYFYYNLPDTSNYSNFQTQAKPLIEELKEAMPLIKTQIISMHEKIVKIINDDSIIINGLKQQLEKYKQDQQKVDDQITELKANNEILKRENQQLKLQTNVTNNTVSQSLIEDLTKKADELAKDYEQAREAEDELRDQLKEKIDLVKILEEAATQTANSINLLTSKVDDLNLQIEESKREAKPQTENTALKSLNEALQRALKATEKGSTKSTPNKKNDDTIVIDDEDSKKKGNKIKLKINTSLQTFSGLPHQNVSEFLHGADRVFEYGQYNDNEKVNAASSYLRGIAYSDWLLHEQENGRQTWRQFTEYMKKKYIPSNHSQVIRSRIKNLKQLTSVKDYYVEFRSLSIQAPEMNTDEKLDHFINNLKPELSKQVHLKECKTIEAAYDAAVLYETFSQPTSNTTNSFMATRQHNHSNMNRNNNRNPRQYQQSNMDNNINNRINNNHSTMNSNFNFQNNNSYENNYNDLSHQNNYENQYQLDKNDYFDEENDYNKEENDDYNDQDNDDYYNNNYNNNNENYEEYYESVYY
jgi:hypothetical protein